MSATSTALRLLSIAQDYSFYSIGIIFVIGLVGNLMNILLLTTLKVLRSNQSAFYLTTESIVNIGELLIIFVGRYLLIILGYDAAKTSTIWCKSRTLIGQIFRLLSTSMICFAAFDQFLSTNPRLYLRQLSTLSLARRLTIVSICIWLLHCIPSAIYLKIDSTPICDIFNIDLIRYFSFFYYPILHGFLPIFISSLFSLLAYRNVRNLIRRQQPVTRRRLDRQLTAMIFVRVIFLIIILLPYSIHRIYLLNITTNPKKDLFQYAINQLVELIIISILNLNYAMTFYLFLMTSSRYRRQVKYFLMKKCWKALKHMCHRHQNDVHPVGEISVGSGTDLE